MGLQDYRINGCKVIIKNSDIVLMFFMSISFFEVLKRERISLIQVNLAVIGFILHNNADDIVTIR